MGPGANERSATVEQIIALNAQLQSLNGDAPDTGHDHREQIKAQLRRLAIVLWSQDPETLLPRNKPRRIGLNGEALPD